MVCLPEYKAGRAEVCKIERVTDIGPGYEHFVRLPDGYLLSCGTDQLRADLVADSMNVMLKWANIYPPVGVVESIVRHSFADEDRMSAELAAQPGEDVSAAPTDCLVPSCLNQSPPKSNQSEGCQ